MAIYTSILTGGSNNHETTSEAANGAQTDLIGEGVVGAITNTGGVAPATGAFAVNAQGTPAMAVDVSAGIAYVTATPTGQNSQNLRIRNTATASVNISANSSGSTKYDWIYLAVDATKAANPAVDGDDVASIVVSRSTSNASDDGTPPTYGILLAKVTVANGATSITNGNIADGRSNITIPVASVDTAQLKDGAVTNAKLATGAGEPGGAWDSWTPTFTNVSGGTLNYAKYKRVGNTVKCRLLYTLAGAGVSGSIEFTLPVNAHADYSLTNVEPLGIGRFGDVSSGVFVGAFVTWNSASKVSMRAMNSSGTYVASSVPSASIPFNWEAGDIIVAAFEYEAA